MTIAEWETKSHWPDGVRERLKGMALPTRLRLAADQVVVTDVASGQSVTQLVTAIQFNVNRLDLMLFNNFAGTNRLTTFWFDADGFWLEEGTLFPDYRERFRRTGQE